MQTLCGMRACGKVLSSPSSAAKHITRHPYPRRSSARGQVWRVRWSRKGVIDEVIDGPRVPKSGPPIHEGIVTGAGQDGPESEHRGISPSVTPCLCDCHYGSPECNEKVCA